MRRMMFCSDSAVAVVSLFLLISSANGQQPLTVGSASAQPGTKARTASQPRAHHALLSAYRQNLKPRTPCFYGRINNSENLPHWADGPTLTAHVFCVDIRSRTLDFGLPRLPP